MKKLLLTGANGFIGRNLNEGLSEKYKIYALARQEVDLLDQEAVDNFFKNKYFDVVLHAAVVGGKRGVQVQEPLSKNLTIFFNLLNQEGHFGKFINFGSGAEYDKSRPIINITEGQFGERIPKDDYGLYKYVCSKYLEGKKNYYNLRLFGVYGKYEDFKTRFISGAILQNLAKKPIVINQNVMFDYLWIEDLVKILKYFIEGNPKFNAYNVASGSKIDLVGIAKIVNQISQYKSEIIVEKLGLNNEYTADISRLKKELSGIKLTSLRSGIKKLFNWYKKYPQI